jgi:hypothetical protein
LHDLPAEVHENQPTGSKAVSGRDRQTDSMVSHKPYFSLSSKVANKETVKDYKWHLTNLTVTDCELQFIKPL